MRRNSFSALLAIADATVLGLAVSASAAEIFTESFESPDITGIVNTDPTGWSGSGHPSYTKHADVDSGVFTTTYGTQAAYIGKDTGKLSTTASILSTTLAPNTDYTLTFNAAARNDKGQTDYLVDLLAGGTVLDSTFGLISASDMSEGGSLTYTTGASHANMGQTLAIRIGRGSAVTPWDHAILFDNVRLDASPSTVVDNDPPTPDPMTWAVAPTAVDFETITMTATEAADPTTSGGVEYLFTNTTTSNSSGWQYGTEWCETGLNPNTPYTYEVKARDLSANQNETAASATLGATTLPPIPGLIFKESFESPDITGLTSDDPTGWQSAGHPGYTGLNDEDSGVLTTPYCSQAARIYSTASFTTTASILSAVLEPNMVYTLGFNVAERSDNAGYDTRYAVDLLAGTAVLGTITGEVTSTDMSEWYSIVFSTGDSHANLGETLAIRLRKGDGGNWQSNPQYDNVTLAAVPAGPDVIPEPSALLIWALGLLGLACHGRRRRR